MPHNAVQTIPSVTPVVLLPAGGPHPDLFVGPAVFPLGLVRRADLRTVRGRLGR